MQKLYYSISEVSEIVDEEQHILRYWEKEFDSLKPKKNRGGNRIYSMKDLALIKAIKKLLRDDKLSLKGAKEQLNRLIFNAGGIETLLSSTEIEGIEIPKTKTVDKFASYPDRRNDIDITKHDVRELHSILNEVLEILR